MTRSEALQKIDDGWRRLSDLLDGFESEDFVATSKDAWSPKDHLAHLNAWERFLLAILEGRDRFASLGVGNVLDQETDEINDAIFQAHRHTSPEAVRAMAAETHRQVRAAIESLAERDLMRLRSDFQEGVAGDEPGEETLLDEIGWNTWDHYEKHIAWLSALVAR